MQPLKALLPITVTLSGILIFTKAVHEEKASEPIDVTESEIEISLNDLHMLNAWLPILVTVSGILTFLSLSQPMKRLPTTLLIPVSNLICSNPDPINGAEIISSYKFVLK